MTITVKLHTTLKKFAPEDWKGGTSEMEVPEGAVARTVVEALGIPENFVGAVFLGSQRGELDDALTQGCELNIIAPIGGG